LSDYQAAILGICLAFYTTIWYIIIMINKKGQFTKGHHWRKPKSYWDRDWLNNEYIIQGKSASQIADEQGCKENNILYFLKKHNIQTRTTKEIRKIKIWGQSGKLNGMYGKTGKQNPNWNGGCSPERQSKYARSAWKELAKSILKRDNYTCQQCGNTKGNYNVHHIKEWSRFPKLRFEPTNLITLCIKCHKKEHSKGVV